MWFSVGVQEKLPVAGIMYNFMPSWWYRNYGIEYGEKMVFDPDYRMQTHQTMRRLMAERYGAMHVGEKDPQLCFVVPDWANAFGMAMNGCHVEYPIDNYPIGNHMTADQVDGLQVPSDLWSIYPFTEIRKQADYMNKVLGTDTSVVLCPVGIMNNAVLLRGTDFLLDLLAEPERADKLLEYCYGLCRKMMDENIKLRMAHRWCWIILNCTVVMAGPKMYHERIMPYDRLLADACHEQGFEFHIHHCGNLDAYAASYRTMDPVNFLEIGSESNVAKAMAMFPEARIQYIIDAKLSRFGNRAQMGDKVQQVLEDTRGNWHRISFAVSDVEYGTPEENLFEVYQRCKEAR